MKTWRTKTQIEKKKKNREIWWVGTGKIEGGPDPVRPVIT